MLPDVSFRLPRGYAPRKFCGMTLDEYLSRTADSEASLAERAKTSAVSINRLLHGEQNPSVDMIRAIVEATDGVVTAHDLVFGKPRQRKTRRAA